MQDIEIIEPQPGYQMKALSSEADIVIGGGAAGAGKTVTLLMECLRHTDVPHFGAVIFRKTSPQIKAEGGLWDASMKLYSKISTANPIESRLEWEFLDKNLQPTVKIKFSHLEYDKNMFDWQGSEIPLIGFDELTHFKNKKVFFYLMSRNRTTCGIKPLIRATCNPDPDSWVAELIAWWIGEDGFPIPERDGVIRYFMVDNDKYIWGNTYEEVIAKGWHVLEALVEKSKIDPRQFIKSITFISGSIFDNKKLLEADPAYLGNLNAQDADTKARLLQGNWKIKVSEEDIYDFNKFADMFTNHHVKEAIDAAKVRLARNTPTKQDLLTRDEDKRITKRCVTADIALKGSDKLLALAWEGKMIIDFCVYDKSNGKVVVGAIKGLAMKHKIPNSEIYFDNDGVGQFVDGFIEGAVEFNNGARAIGGANYNHLKSQCYFLSGDAVANAEYYIPEKYDGREVANRRFDDDYTLRERLIFERRAIKRAKVDDDGKLQVIKKSEMKVYLNGESPDVMDAFMMREFVDLRDPKIYSTSDETINSLNY